MHIARSMVRIGDFRAFPGLFAASASMMEIHIQLIFSSIFLFLDSIGETLHRSQFKIIFIYLASTCLCYSMV